MESLIATITAEPSLTSPRTSLAPSIRSGLLQLQYSVLEPRVGVRVLNVQKAVLPAIGLWAIFHLCIRKIHARGRPYLH